jgi:hypothetical protein
MLDLGKRETEKTDNEYVSVSGVGRMTDGCISEKMDHVVR